MNRVLAEVRNWAAIGWALLWMWRNHNAKTFWQLVKEHYVAGQLARKGRRHYTVLNDEQALARRLSRRVYLFGSGYSLNELDAEEWAEFSKHDTIGFSGSIYLQKIPLTYLLLRAWNETSAGSLAWKKDTRDVLEALENNSYLNDTLFVLQKGLTAIFSNRLVGFRLWSPGRKLYFFLADKVSHYPHRDIRAGLVHGKSTLCSAVSLAVGLGYEEIVLVGVDLYDSRYFWLPQDKTLGWSESEQKLVASDRTVRGAKTTSVHNTVHNGIIDYLGDWNRHLQGKYGVSLFVYNPKSLLTKSLPIFPRN